MVEARHSIKDKSKKRKLHNPCCVVGQNWAHDFEQGQCSFSKKIVAWILKGDERDISFNSEESVFTLYMIKMKHKIGK
jgi:hypothetical protein